MLSRQEMFNTMVNHLRKQGCISYNSSSCAYRGQNGTKCAVGALIPDEDYTPYFEGERPTTSSNVGVYFLSKGFTNNDLDFLLHAQECLHDDLGEFASTFEDSLKLAVEHFAQFYNLKVPEYENRATV